MSALTNCVGKSTASTWKRAIEVLETVQISELEHVQPSHATEIAQKAPRDSWPEWVEDCEREKWTVQELRGRLKASKFEKVGTTLTADGYFDVLVIDPPWPIEKIERVVRPHQVHFDYPVLSIDEIRDYKLTDGRQLQELSTANAHCFLWTTQRFLPTAFELLTSWQLSYVCTFVWHKAGGFQPIGLPQYNCEFALYARKGAPAFIDTKDFPLCFEAPRAEHSRKPALFYETLRRVTAGRRVDIFSREPHEGFEQLGNEIGKFNGQFLH